jgi:dihydrolipoamide dehydrogenase
VVFDEQESTILNFDKLIIATGSKAFIPPLPGSDLPGVVTSSELLSLNTLPESICIIGGGVIAMEFAYIMNALGLR